MKGIEMSVPEYIRPSVFWSATLILFAVINKIQKFNII